VEAALVRAESRGVHFRSDFPKPDDQNWRRHLSMKIDVDGGHPRVEPILQAEEPGEVSVSAPR
ncbi:MAG: hypothetical protein ACPHJ3_20965, partial [Rubripirellula sp.]